MHLLYEFKRHNKTLEGDPYQRFCCVLAASFGSCLDARSLSGSVAGITSPISFAKKMVFSRRQATPLLLGIAFFVGAISLAVRGCGEYENDTPANQQYQETHRPTPPDKSIVMSSDLEAAGELIAAENSVHWTDPKSGRDFQVRLHVRMIPHVRVKEGGENAVGDITISFKEGADYWSEDLSAWTPMQNLQYYRFRRGGPSLRAELPSAEASIVKRAGRGGEPSTIESQIAFGTSKQDEDWDWDKAENGLGVALDWKGSDLVVRWECQLVGGEKAVEGVVTVPFSDRYR